MIKIHYHARRSHDKRKDIDMFHLGETYHKYYYEHLQAQNNFFSSSLN